MKIRLWFLCLFLLGSGALKANQVTDSLENLLIKATDTTRVKILCDLCWEYRFISSEKALAYGEQALKLARDLDFKKGLAQSLNDMGIIHIDHSRYDEAILSFKESMLTSRRKSLPTGNSVPNSKVMN